MAISCKGQPGVKHQTKAYSAPCDVFAVRIAEISNPAEAQPFVSKPGGGNVTEPGVEPTSSECMTGDRTTDLNRSAVISGTGIHRLIYRDVCVAATAHNPLLTHINLGYSSTPRLIAHWHLHDIAITNIIWCLAHERGFGVEPYTARYCLWAKYRGDAFKEAFWANTEWTGAQSDNKRTNIL